MVCTGGGKGQLPGCPCFVSGASPRYPRYGARYRAGPARRPGAAGLDPPSMADHPGFVHLHSATRFKDTRPTTPSRRV